MDMLHQILHDKTVDVGKLHGIKIIDSQILQTGLGGNRRLQQNAR